MATRLRVTSLGLLSRRVAGCFPRVVCCKHLLFACASAPPYSSTTQDGDPLAPLLKPLVRTTTRFFPVDVYRFRARHSVYDSKQQRLVQYLLMAVLMLLQNGVQQLGAGVGTLAQGGMFTGRDNSVTGPLRAGRCLLSRRGETGVIRRRAG